MITADFHTHTHHSGDSDAPMAAVTESALLKGLTHLCFTDHTDFDYPTTHDAPGTFELDPTAYYDEFAALRDRYADRIALFFGVELGLQPSCAEKNARFVADNPFDFVIGSVHVVEGEDPYYPEYFKSIASRMGLDPDDPASLSDPGVEKEALHRYFEEVLEVLPLCTDFDVFGHFDVVNRYFASGKRAYDYRDHADILEAILAFLVKHDKGLDCNTRLLQRGADEMNPSNAILKRYFELGGRIITFGSDAHVPQYVGEGFDRGEEIARAIGFTEYCTFRKRTPAFHAL